MSLLQPKRKEARRLRARREGAIITAVIFDVDGTLVDTVDMHARAWKESLDYFGRDVPCELVRAQIGKGGDQLMPVFLSEDEIETFGDELQAYRAEHWRRNYLPKVKPFPAVPELFRRIRRDNKKIIIASSANQEDLDMYKRIAGIDSLIDGEVSATDVERSKPAPDIFLAALSELDHLSVSEAVVVGDSPYDALAAGEIGLETVGLRCGGFPDEALLEAGAVELYNDPSDLLDHYEASLLCRSFYTAKT